MATFNIHEAKTHFSRLVEDAAAGREVIIAKSGKPVARIVSMTAGGGPGKPPRQLGLLRGKVRIPDDFDAPLPGDVLDEFERPLSAELKDL